MARDLKKLLPDKFTSIAFWRDLVDSSQSVLWDPTIDLIKKVGDFRYPSRVEAAYLVNMLENLGLYINTETITESQLRRIIDHISYFYEKSGTLSTVDLLSFLKSTEDHIVTIELIDLYSRKDVDRELVSLDGNAPYSYTGFFAKPPVVKGTVNFSIGSETWTDENGILNASGKPSPSNSNIIEKGAGSVDYETGTYHIELKQQFQSISHNGIGGKFRLKHREGDPNEVETSDLQFNATAAEIKTALDAQIKQVEGESLFAGGNFTTHAGAFAYPPVEKRSVRIGFPNTGTQYWTDREAQAFHLTSKKQSVSIANANGGVFTLTHQGQTTEAISLNAIDKIHLTHLVTHGTFTLAYGSTLNPPATTKISPSGVFRISKHVDISGGTFTLSYGTGSPNTTVNIAHNASSSVIQAALINLHDIESNGVEVSGTGASSDPWEVIFINPSLNVSDLTVNDTHLTGESVGNKLTIERLSAASVIEEKLEALTGIDNVTVSGSGTEDSPWEVSFISPIVPTGSLQLNPGGLSANGASGKHVITYIRPNNIIEEYLERLEHFTDVEVTGSGSVASPWIVEFNDANSQDLPLLTVNVGELTANESGNAAVSVTVTRVRSATGTFMLSYNGDPSANINANFNNQDIEAAISGITSVSVAILVGEGTLESPWYVVLTDSSNNESNLSLLEANGDGLTSGNIVSHGKREILLGQQGDTSGFGTINHATGAYSVRFDSTQVFVQAKADYNSDSLRTAVTGTGSTKDPWLIFYKYYGAEKKLLTAETSLFPSIARMEVTSNISVDYDTRQYQGLYDNYDNAFQHVSKGEGVTGGFFQLTYRRQTTRSIPVNGVARRISLNREVTGGNFSLAFRNAREIYLHKSVSGGTFTLTYDGHATGHIAHDADASVLKASLESLSNITTVNVTGDGTEQSPWVVEFMNPGSNIAAFSANALGLTGVPAGESGATVEIAGGNITGETTAIEVNIVQEVVVDSTVTGGTFTLTYEGQITDNIDHDATADDIESAVEGLSNIAEVTVAGKGTLTSPWKIRFANPSSNVSRFTANGANLTGGDDLPANANMRVNVHSNVSDVIEERISLISGLSAEVEGKGTDGNPWIVKFSNAGEAGYLTVNESDLIGGSGNRAMVDNDFNSAKLIQLYLEGVENISAGWSIRKVNVSGAGSSDDPWVVKFINPSPKSAFTLGVENQLVTGGTMTFSRESGVLTSAGGDWYLTNQVDLRVNENDVEENREFISDMEKTFYNVAPATMVMRSVSGLREISGPGEMTSYLAEKQFVKLSASQDSILPAPTIGQSFSIPYGYRLMEVEAEFAIPVEWDRS